MVKEIYRLRISRDDNPSNPREDSNVTTMWCWHNRYDLGDKNPYKREDPEHAIKVLIGEYNPDFEEQLDEWWSKSSSALEREHGEGFHYKSEYKRAMRDLHDEYASKLQEELEKYYVVLPLYLYDHSGITMSTGAFSCPWDSGRVGFIYISHDTANKEFGGDLFQDKTSWNDEKTKRCKEILKNDVEVYDQYITGDVYGFEMQKLVYEFEQPADENIDPEDDDLPWEDGDSCWGFFGDKIEENGMLDHTGMEFKDAAKEAMDDLDTWKLVVIEPKTAQEPEVANAG
jgi:hypothetical protein